ncbi:MAG: hypothetical protein GDYSWBUE_000582 [Candidatus Fervidibacterota bacterium]
MNERFQDLRVSNFIGGQTASHPLNCIAPMISERVTPVKKATSRLHPSET